ncbi:FadR/GntR family transcriptional regulator [Ornithinimicrobium panacihumi]|uniref:FadR/GntR family transcriptional regulator n=1 Tax=Ornithinimicrobium panacihumi TaxID=2008449 RepID=UPI003F88776D
MGDAAAPKAYEVVVGWIEERILAGTLAVGDSLPAERDLATQLGVSRSAVREAVRTLQAQGVLQSSVGAGAAGGTRVTAMSSGALTRLLRVHVALAHFPLEDVLEVRVALERLSVRLAAEGASAEQLEGLRGRLADLRSARTRTEFNDADTAFHVAVAEAAGNRLAAETTIAIRESVRGPLMDRFASLDEAAWAKLSQELNAEHQAILDAIEAGDAAAGEVVMEEHVRTAWSRLEVAEQ